MTHSILSCDNRIPTIIIIMADRKAELELKRKRLEELRKNREQQKKESANKAVYDVICNPSVCNLIISY